MPLPLVSAARLGGVALLASLLFVLGLLPASSQAADRSGFTVTMAARVCDRYTDIFGNRARNNIMESLKDLGPDTPYEAGEPVNPATEDLSPQSKCKPLPDWTFTLGTSYRSRAVSGPWGSLSIVTSPYAAPTMVTKPSVPELDGDGRPTGRQILGATNIELTDAQADRAASPSALWLQGGTTTDPVLDTPFPGQYGFGALRCALDNVNGDNVEWIGFPQGARHVFCYAYYVKPPPTSGTIIVRKEVDAPAGTTATPFTFNGNISFNSDGNFTVPAAPGIPGSETFYRAEVTGLTPPWSFAELVPAGWTLTGLTCSSQAGTSTSTTDLSRASASVRLAAGDTVICTYTDKFTPPPAGLLINKISYGGVGTFDWDVSPAGDGPTATSAIRHVSATTTLTDTLTPGTPTLSLDAGAYKIQETLPSNLRGRWRLLRATCNGALVPSVQPVNITLTSGQGAVCTFENAFRPNGTIRIHKKTVGGVGTAGFVINRIAKPVAQYEQTATTTRENQAVLARGDDTSAVRLGGYSIQETAPSDSPDGVWSLESLTCNGKPVGTAQGRAEITLTRAAPDVDCTFTNRFTPTDVLPPVVPDGGGTDPDQGGVSPDDIASPAANLVITKRVSASNPRVGEPVTYTVTVENRGPDTAKRVTVVEQDVKSSSPVKVTTSQGYCRTSRPVVCVIGSMPKGRVVRLTAITAYTATGAFRNTVAVNTSTYDPLLGNDTASARVLVGPLVKFTG